MNDRHHPTAQGTPSLRPQALRPQALLPPALLPSLGRLACAAGLGITVQGAALAAPTAHYLPDGVAGKSAAFKAAAEASAPPFNSRNKTLEKVGDGLRLLDLGVALLGDQADPALRAWTAEQRKRAAGEGLRLQRHLDLLQNDYGEQFGAAVARALTTVAPGREVQACEPPPRLPGMPGGNKSPCPGEDLSAAIAAKIDLDPKLKSALTDINAVPWPEVSTPKQEWAPLALTGTAAWVNLGAVAEATIGRRIAQHRAELEGALEPLSPRLSAGDAAALAEAKALRAAYEAKLSADGKVLKDALKVTLEKTKGAPSGVGLCANAPVLGGCAGEDRTREVIALLADNKTWQKATAALQN